METQTSVRTCGGATNGCLIIISVHQASALSFLDEITRHISVNILWCMLFSNDIVLLDETREMPS